MRPAGDRPPPPPRLSLDGRIDPARIADLCDRAGRSLASGEGDLVVDLGGLAAPDVAAIEAAARLALTARRIARGVRFRGACEELARLAALCGLDETLALEPSGVEPRRQPEQREQPLGVEEEADP